MVGVSQSCLMGFNGNRGMEIHLRLRTDDWAGLRPYASIVDVLCHELAHNVDDHDDNFKALKSTLSREYSLHLARERARRRSAAPPRAPDERRRWRWATARTCSAAAAARRATRAAAAAAAERQRRPPRRGACRARMRR